jgi:hypothetical protein
MRYLKFGVVMLCLILIAGCATAGRIVLYPIQDTDIIFIKKGDQLHFSDGKVIQLEKDGCFVSDLYMEEVLRIKVGK